VLSGRGLCDELITCPEESYRLWFVVVCDLETSRMRRPWPALGRSATAKKKKATLKIFPEINLFNSCVTILQQVIFLSHGATAPSGVGPLRYRGFTITRNDTPHSVGLLWASDQPDAQTSTWQHTTLPTEIHPSPRRDSDPQSQQASGHKPAP